MIRLHHLLDESTPHYGGSGLFTLDQEKCMGRGDSCDTLRLTMGNHVGTHVDLPAHFDPAGRRLRDLPDDFWWCSATALLEADLAPAELCGPDHLESALAKWEADRSAAGAPGQAGARDAEAVLLRTGWEARRGDRDYWANAPGFAPECADWLRGRFPRLKFFGFDLISLSSLPHRETGRAAHRAFLRHPRPICIVEDMRLSPLHTAAPPFGLLVSPLPLAAADGAPVSVWVPER